MSPLGNVAEQTDPQLRPEGVEETSPLPDPIFVHLEE